MLFSKQIGEFHVPHAQKAKGPTATHQFRQKLGLGQAGVVAIFLFTRRATAYWLATLGEFLVIIHVECQLRTPVEFNSSSVLCVRMRRSFANHRLTAVVGERMFIPLPASFKIWVGLPIQNIQEKLTSFGLLMQQSGCAPRMDHNAVVPHLAEPMMIKVGFFGSFTS